MEISLDELRPQQTLEQVRHTKDRMYKLYHKCLKNNQAKLDDLLQLEMTDEREKECNELFKIILVQAEMRYNFALQLKDVITAIENNKND